MSKGRPSAEREPRGSGLEAVFGRGANAFRRRFGVVAVAAIVLLVVLGAVLAWRQYEDSKQKALNDMHARVVLAATVFDTYFAGQLGTLSAIAESPSVVRTDTDQMATYFAALQSSSKQELFTGGLGWIDRSGTSRVSGSNPRGTRLRVTDRSFFKAVISTGQAVHQRRADCSGRRPACRGDGCSDARRRAGGSRVSWPGRWSYGRPGRTTDDSTWVRGTRGDRPSGPAADVCGASPLRRTARWSRG